MSFAPASSLGAFLKARLAVNGIQCAARSFGKLTAAGRGLLSSMGASCVLEILATPGQAISFAAGRKRHRIAIFALIRAVGDRPSQIGGADPEHFALGILGVEPQGWQLRKCGLEQLAAAADLAQ